LALLPELERKQAEQLTLFDVSGITDQGFWEQVEDVVFSSLAQYATDASSVGATQRRLFAEDAALGFAFIDLCRQRFDVVLMNPPFGDPTPATKGYIDTTYGDSRQDLFACFVERALGSLTPDGICGLISTEAGFFRRTLEPWRRKIVLERSSL